MNRDEYLEYLLESLPRWPDDNHSAPHGWEFVDGQYVHTFHAPINIDEWNRAKIKPNTKIRILSEEHGEYAKRLFFKSDLYPNPAIPSSFKSEEESFMFFKGDGRITFAVTSSVFIKSECKEIFIEMPKAKYEKYHIDTDISHLISSNDEIPTNISANGSVGRMVTLNIPAEGSSNINAKVLAEKVNAIDIQVDGNHYKDQAIQPVEYIHANGIGYFEGNVIKYVSRWRKKNGIADLEKAKHYIELLIELENNQ